MDGHPEITHIAPPLSGEHVLNPHGLKIKIFRRFLINTVELFLDSRRLSDLCEVEAVERSHRIENRQNPPVLNLGSGIEL